MVLKHSLINPKPLRRLRVRRKNVIRLINYIDWSTRSDRQRWWWYRTELAVGPFERAWSQVFRTVLVEFSGFCSEKPLQKQNGSLLLNVFARKIYQRSAMDLNRHTSSDESGGNLGAELSYLIWPSISSGESINSDFCSENFGFGQKSEILVSPEEMLDHM